MRRGGSLRAENGKLGTGVLATAATGGASDERAVAVAARFQADAATAADAARTKEKEKHAWNTRRPSQVLAIQSLQAEGVLSEAVLSEAKQSLNDFVAGQIES